jgi:hypothetical protein
LTIGLLYTYLANYIGKRDRGNAFRSLQRGYTHWASGRLKKLDIHVLHPLYCHVRCHMTPSMKQGKYLVYILLGHSGMMATIERATCECAAGYV